MSSYVNITNAIVNRVSGCSLTASHELPCDPHDVVVDVVITTPNGLHLRVPAFWNGEREWCVRFAPPKPGTYLWRSECSGAGRVEGLHDDSGTIMAADYQGENPLWAHGAVRVAHGRRTFEHLDGTPFLWLADTWWMGLTSRLTWPDDFRELTSDRVSKGFTVVQIVAGLYPDMEWGDPRGANEAGLPYDRSGDLINLSYFDMADLRIAHLVRSGIVPCVVGAWGYFIITLGVERMKRHWRNLIARWGAYPVVWCVAGEATMPYYLSETKTADAEQQKAGWTEVARYVRSIDPMRRPITIHPTEIGRDQLLDDAVLDFDMLQTGHGGYASISNTVAKVRHEVARTPTMPVLVGETNYEGIMQGNHDEIQRMSFWSSMMSGCAGHTYGANGIWQFNTRDQPFGPSPHGNTWGGKPWKDAMHLEGSACLAVGKRVLERLRWWEFRPHQEWISPAPNPGDCWAPFAAGIPGKVRLIYTFHPVWCRSLTVAQLEPGVTYQASFVNPSTGKSYPLGPVEPDADGKWLAPQQPELRDWLLLLDAG